MTDPATGELLAAVADADPEDGMAALDAVCAAQDAWARTAPRERADILFRAYEIVLARREDFALLMTLEMGKPLAEARGEVDPRGPGGHEHRAEGREHLEALLDLRWDRRVG